MSERRDWWSASTSAARRFRAAAAPADATDPACREHDPPAERPARSGSSSCGAALDAASVSAARHGSVSGLRHRRAGPGRRHDLPLGAEPALSRRRRPRRAFPGRTSRLGNDAHLALLAEATAGAAAGATTRCCSRSAPASARPCSPAGASSEARRAAACSFGWACADVDDPGDDRLGWLERHAAGPALDALGAGMTPPVDGAGAGRRRGERRRRRDRTRSARWRSRSGPRWPVRLRCSIRAS